MLPIATCLQRDFLRARKSCCLVSPSCSPDLPSQSEDRCGEGFLLFTSRGGVGTGRTSLDMKLFRLVVDLTPFPGYLNRCYPKRGSRPPRSASKPDMSLSRHPAPQRYGSCHEYLSQDVAHAFDHDSADEAHICC